MRPSSADNDKNGISSKNSLLLRLYLLAGNFITNYNSQSGNVLLPILIPTHTCIIYLFIYLFIRFEQARSRASAVGIATMLQARPSGSANPVGTRYFSLLRISRLAPRTYPIGTKVIPGG